ncbi:MAG: GNAT family N-acetyltransferase [Chloroflexia bacterium]|nr:GNAT family N-acetyltransferase [Chloroflexia bacterium]
MDNLDRKFGPLIDGPDPILGFIITIDGVDAGYIQGYRIDDHPDYARQVAVGPGAACVDLLLGDPARRNQGWGVPVLRAFLRDVVFGQLDATFCIIGPDTANARAIRSYEKAGFRYLKTVSIDDADDPGDEYLMVLTSDELARLAGTALHAPDPILIGDLFAAERTRLLDLLDELTADQWRRSTVCAGWSVKDIVAHLLANDLGRLSRGRDGYQEWGPAPGERLLAFIDRQNAEWVRAMRRISPQVLRDLLERSGEETATLFATLDPFATGGPVDWAGPDPAPVWLDLAREYTERWHHQQHIRNAVTAAELTELRFFAPVLATFVRALPHTFRDVDAPPGTAVQVSITGESGGEWAVMRERDMWTLFSGIAPDAAAHVTLEQTLAWRLFTKGVSSASAERDARIDGDRALGQMVLNTVAIIA